MKKYIFFMCVLMSFFSLNAQIVPDGTYQIYSDIHSESMIDTETADNDVAMTTADISDNKQLWVFTHQGDNKYKIYNKASGSYVGIKDNWCGQFGDVQARYAETDSNVEFLISAGDNPGTYVLQIGFTTCNFGSVNDPVRAFDIAGGSSGGQIQTYDVDTSSANQQFRLISADAIIPDGTYQIYSDIHSEAMIDTETTDNDVAMTTADISDSKQLWVFTHQGDNKYKINNVASGSYVGIKDNWCGQFGDVQARYAETDSNVEFLISAGNNTGSYVFQIAFTTCNFGSVNDPVRAFDISGGSSGGQIQTFDVDTNSANQQFRLISHEWTGSSDTNWANTANWTPSSVPTSSSNVRIPNVTNKPVISAAATSKDVLINSSSSIQIDNSFTVSGDFTNMGSTTVSAGNSILVSGSSSGNITYNVNVSDTNWHLVSSPVAGAEYDDTWVTNNDIATGSVSSSNRGISTYNNGTPDGTTGHWRYYQGGTTETFGSGTGYSFKKGTSGGSYSFVGTIPSSNSPAISQSTNNWNLIGNSFPSYMDIASFITTNDANLSAAFKAIYVWNAPTSSYQSLTTGHLHPGQAFFINSNVASGNASITTAMQSHQTGVTFYKNNNPSITLSIEQGKAKKSTLINFDENATASLDPGLDIGLFDGVDTELGIYTHLIENNAGIKFGKQALSLSTIENTVIPIGVKANANQEIEFSLTLENLSPNLEVFLEDKQTNTFTSFDSGVVNIKTTENISEVGRFYLHISNTSLNTETNSLVDISLFQPQKSQLKIVGLYNAETSLNIFTIYGKQVLKTSFIAKGNDQITLPKLSKGVYVVQIENEKGKLNKKVILE